MAETRHLDLAIGEVAEMYTASRLTRVTLSNTGPGPAVYGLSPAIPPAGNDNWATITPLVGPGVGTSTIFWLLPGETIWVGATAAFPAGIEGVFCVAGEV